jgi:YVTN family beta-propeller protein
LLQTAGPVAQAAPFAYITNQGSHDVSVIDLAGPRVVATIPVGQAPAGVVAGPRGEVFVANAASHSVTVIHTASQQAAKTFAAGQGAVGLDLSADGRRLFVADWFGQQLRVFDAASREPISSTPLGRAPAGVAALPDGSAAWVAERDEDRVALIDAAGGVLARVAVGTHPFALLLDGPRQRLYVLNVESDNLSVVDVRRRQVIATLPTGRAPYGAALADHGRLLYVTNQHADSVSVFDAETLTLRHTLTGFGYPEGIAAFADRVCVVNWMDDSVSLLDAASGRRLAEVPVGRNPRGFGAFIAPLAAAGPPELRAVVSRGEP